MASDGVVYAQRTSEANDYDIGFNSTRAINYDKTTYRKSLYMFKISRCVRGGCENYTACFQVLDYCAVFSIKKK